MKTKLDKKQEGFTIIEVVLVLAIAGLIFLIVFLALPALQRSRRDTQRKNDAGRLLSAMETYAGNNNGEYPTAFNASFVNEYLDGDFNDPSGTAYLSISSGNPGFITFADNSVCDGDSIDTNATSYGDREIAVQMLLEDGQYCQDNQ